MITIKDARSKIANTEALLQKLDSWNDKFEQVSRLEMDLLAFQKKQIEVTDPMDKSAVRELGDVTTQLILIPARRKHAEEGRLAAWMEVIKDAEGLRSTIEGLRDAEILDMIDRIEKILTPFAPKFTDTTTGERWNPARGAALHCTVLGHIRAMATWGTTLPPEGNLRNGFIQRPETAITETKTHVAELLGILASWVDRKTFIHPNFGKSEAAA